MPQHKRPAERVRDRSPRSDGSVIPCRSHHWGNCNQLLPSTPTGKLTHLFERRASFPQVANSRPVDNGTERTETSANHSDDHQHARTRPNSSIGNNERQATEQSPAVLRSSLHPRPFLCKQVRLLRLLLGPRGSGCNAPPLPGSSARGIRCRLPLLCAALVRVHRGRHPLGSRPRRTAGATRERTQVVPATPGYGVDSRMQPGVSDAWQGMRPG